MIINLPNVPTQTEFFAFQGGMDKTSPALRVPPGMVTDSLNYEPDQNGGYSRAKGYERFDGRSQPSAGTYTLLACTLVSTPAVGALVTMGGITGLFMQVEAGGCTLVNVSGAIPASTNMTVGGSSVGTTAANVNLPKNITTLIETQYRVAAANLLRSGIADPVGSGPIRGIQFFDGSLFAFRDNAGGTAGQMWRSSSTGWTLQALGEEVSFSNANINVGEGDTLTQGAVTALVTRVVLETGSLASGTNTGRLMLSTRAGGNFSAAVATSTGSGTLTLSGIQTAITLPAGGRYQFDITNFAGGSATMRMYGCNGVGRAFEYGGGVFTPLKTGAADDRPFFIKANRNYLYVAQGSSLMNSSVANPYRWLATEGAAEIPVGQTITGICALPGEAVGVFTHNSSHALTGASVADWSMQNIRSDVGATPYTVMNMSEVYLLDDRGITSISAVQAYGNFADATMSRKIQPLIDEIRSSVIGAYVSRTKGHYVLATSTGRTLTMGINNGKLTGFMEGKLAFTPSCVFSGEDTSGVERVFMGSTSGRVYELERGSSFDGDAIEALVKISYYNSKSPRVRKRYRKLVMEMNAALYSELRVQVDYTYGTPDIGQSVPVSVVSQGGGASWDFSNWDQFFWDLQSINQPEVSLDGTGLNIALIFYSNTALDFGHTLQGAILHYTPRRQQR